MLKQYLVVAAITIVAFSIVYFIAQFHKNNSLIDSFWGVGFVIIAIFSLLITLNLRLPQVIVTFLVILWGVRLSARISLRNKGKPEDWRYAAWRTKWGSHASLRSYTDVFLPQAVLCFVIALPVIFVNIHSVNIKYPALLALGIIVWLVGFIFEAIGDSQLDEFKNSKSSTNEVLDTGLWKYSRHPNYFGEATLWWGIGIIALSCSFSALWTLIGPITITFLLLKVSGVPMLEKKMSKNPKYKSYMSKTNRFIPGSVKQQ